VGELLARRIIEDNMLRKGETITKDPSIPPAQTTTQDTAEATEEVKQASKITGTRICK